MKQEEDFLKRQFPTSEKGSGAKKEHPAMQILNETVVVCGLGIDAYCRLLYYRFYYTIPATYSLYWLSGYIVRQAYHLKLLRYLEPGFFTINRLRWFYRFNYDQHLWTVFALISIFILLVLGFRKRFIRTKYQKIFECAGLITRTNDTPVLVNRKKLPHKRLELEFDTKGVSRADFEEKKERLEAKLGQSVESIETGKNPSFVKVVLTSQKLPDQTTYREISSLCALPEESFYVGMSMEGPIIQNIADLPHMLIAGSTNTGKSVFFKQCLMGLLESTPHIQMYLIDLKGGLEMIDFKYAPNVKIVKTMKEAVSLLQQLKTEMEDRFSYLEKKNYKSIDPHRDGKERIIVAVDEASVLYTKRYRHDPDFHLANEARALTDHLSKLSRAAAFNLILATQKLLAEVLPTTVTENISGRMAFRAETLQGSLLVIGNRDAYDLPKIKGRGIWSCGNKQNITQAPFVSDKDVQEFSKRIGAEFKGQQRKSLNEMVGSLQNRDNKSQQDAVKKAKERL